MIQIELQPEVESQLAAQAEQHGLTFSEYLKYLLIKQAEQHWHVDHSSIEEAIRGIRELRRGNQLGDIKIKDLIHEGHKY